MATDKLPLARSASTTAYAATVAEIAAFANGAYVPNYATANPSMDGAASPGTAITVSRGDHVHPVDTSRAPLNSPAFTGSPVLPGATTGFTQSTSDSSTKLATTGYVQGAMVAAGAGVSSFNGRAGTVTLSTADVVAVSPYSADVGRNLLHNALFNVAQRGVGPFSAAGYTLDRWYLNFGSDTGVSVQAIAAVDATRTGIGDEAATNLLQFSTTGNAAAAAYSQITHSIEGVRRLAGKTITVSFWAVPFAAGLKLGLNGYSNYGTGGAPSAAAAWAATGTAVTLTAAWARYSATFTVSSAAGKTLGTNGNDCTVLQIFLSSGATNNASAGNIGVQSGTVQLWGVQLEIGSVATPLEKLDPRNDLANCQRFYCILGNISVSAGPPATAAGQQTYGHVTLPVTMRAVPTVGVPVQSSTNCSAAAPLNQFAQGFDLYITSLAAGSFYATLGPLTASADL